MIVLDPTISYKLAGERANRRPERRAATRTYPLHFALTLLIGFVTGLAFALPWIFENEDISRNTQGFWLTVFGG